MYQPVWTQTNRLPLLLKQTSAQSSGMTSPTLTSITSLLLGLFSSVVTILAWVWWGWLVGALPRLCPSRDLKMRFSWIRRGPLEVVTPATPIYGSSLWDWCASEWFQCSLFIQQKPLDSNCPHCMPIHPRQSPWCFWDFDSFWFREITRQSDETSWSPKAMGYCDMGLWLWYWGRLRGEKKQNRISSAFPAHFPSSTGRKLLPLKVQSAVEMDIAKHCLAH